MPKKKYVVWCSINRKEEFEFNCDTQDHICSSLKQARELADYKEGTRYNDAYPKFKIYEITLKEIKCA